MSLAGCHEISPGIAHQQKKPEPRKGTELETRAPTSPTLGSQRSSYNWPSQTNTMVSDMLVHVECCFSLQRNPLFFIYFYMVQHWTLSPCTGHCLPALDTASLHWALPPGTGQHCLPALGNNVSLPPKMTLPRLLTDTTGFNVFMLIFLKDELVPFSYWVQFGDQFTFIPAHTRQKLGHSHFKEGPNKVIQHPVKRNTVTPMNHLKAKARKT